MLIALPGTLTSSPAPPIDAPPTLIGMPGDLIRATVALIALPATLTLSPTRLIDLRQTLIAAASRVIGPARDGLCGVSTRMWKLAAGDRTAERRSLPWPLDDAVSRDTTRVSRRDTDWERKSFAMAQDCQGLASSPSWYAFR